MVVRENLICPEGLQSTLGKMPSTIELILFLLSLIVFAVLLFSDWYRAGLKASKHTDQTPSSAIRCNSAVYWFRDYWSNRRRLGRNIQNERSGWKNSVEFDIDSLRPGELVVQRNEDGSSVREPGGQPLFAGLVDPQDLVRRYEPRCISVLKQAWGRRPDTQTPQEWVRLGDYMGNKFGLDVDEYMARAGSKPIVRPPLAVEEELIAHMKSDLKTVSLFNPLFGYSISFFWYWLIFEYVLGFVFRVLLPWLEPILFPLMVLGYAGLAYGFVFRVIDEMGLDVRNACEIIFLYDGERPGVKHYRYAGDVPGWLGSKPYWVFRYLYLWRGELTVKKGFLPLHFKPDWERVEVWLDARSGMVEWIVTDYHWRELWYKAEAGLSRIYVWILPNFHTPRPLTLKHEGGRGLRDLYVQGHPSYQAWKRYVWNVTATPEFSIKSERRRWEERLRFISSQIMEGGWTLKPNLIVRILPHRISRYFAVATEAMVITTLAKIWWCYWRYPLGADSERYQELESSPDWEPGVGEQPSACAKKNHNSGQ